MKTDKARKLKKHSLLPVLIIIIGFGLLLFMIVVEDEPGAIPLLLIIAGTVWLLTIRSKARSRKT